jgi:hypothetical protein
LRSGRQQGSAVQDNNGSTPKNAPKSPVYLKACGSARRAQTTPHADMASYPQENPGTGQTLSFISAQRCPLSLNTRWPGRSLRQQSRTPNLEALAASIADVGPQASSLWAARKHASQQFSTPVEAPIRLKTAIYSHGGAGARTAATSGRADAPSR